MHTFHQVACDVLVDYGFQNVRQVFTYSKFKLAWYTYLELLNTDYTQGFICSLCSCKPDIIVCDGTSVSFQSRMWHHQAVEPVSTKVVDIVCRFVLYINVVHFNYPCKRGNADVTTMIIMIIIMIVPVSLRLNVHLV